MLLSAVSALAVAQSSSKIPEGLMNDLVCNVIWWEYYLPVETNRPIQPT